MWHNELVVRGILGEPPDGLNLHVRRGGVGKGFPQVVVNRIDPLDKNELHLLLLLAVFTGALRECSTGYALLFFGGTGVSKYLRGFLCNAL